MTCTSGTCGVGGWGGPLPGDPSNNSILSAVSAFGGIDVTWNLPTTNPHAVAYTRLYRGLTNNFAGAMLIREVAGSFYYDKLDAAVLYYYWIEIVSVNGTVGETIGPASAVANPTIAGMIELLTGQIDDGLLATSLKTQLDQISVLNTNLLNEITDRENGETTLAEAIADAQAGIAEAHTFIINETASRTSQDSAIVEQINGVAAALGDDIAAVTTTMTAAIDDLTGEVTAMYMAKVTVNGLVGGFGIINDGAQVQAGFDVDTFWVGRTSADKRKPFIISGGVCYLDEAAIQKLTFSKLRDESGSFIVQDGKVKADYLNVTSASIVNLDFNKLTDSTGTFVVSGGKIQGNYLTVTNASIVNAAVTTLKIGDEAVTVPQFYTGANRTNVGSTPVTLLTASFDAAGGGYIGTLTFYVAPSNVDAYGEVEITVNGVVKQTQRFGIRTTGGGDTYYNMPVSVAFSGSNVTTVNISATVKAIPHPGGSTNDIDVTNVSLAVMGAKR